MNMQNLMAQAKKMQKDIQEKQEMVNNEIFEASSQAVSVKVNGKKEVLNVVIDKSIIKDEEDIESLEDMIQIAMNDAFKQVDKEMESKLGAYANGLNGLM